MPQSPLPDVVSHWHKLVEDFETSPKEFYSAIEAGLERREIPGLRTSRIDFGEGGILTAKREYLRVARGKHSFDICAAPFGTSFFFSSWLTERRPRWLVLWALGFLALCAAVRWMLNAVVHTIIWQTRGMQSALQSDAFSLTFDLLMWVAVVLVALGIVGLAARAGFDEPERAILELPILGWVHARVFAPQTYYRIDTMLMFQSAVQGSMLEVINSLLTAKGLRALNEGEEKPVLQQLVDKRHSIPDEVLAAAR